MRAWAQQIAYAGLEQRETDELWQAVRPTTHFVAMRAASTLARGFGALVRLRRAW